MFRRLHVIPLILFLALGLASSARAALQFDVFLGYDGVVPEGAWFPVMFEVKNDGPTFTGTVEVDGGAYNQGQVRRMIVELPTGTLKRFVIPVFSTTRGYSTWDARLLDERGKVRAEQPGLRPRKQIASRTVLLGAIPRTATGTPIIRPIAPQQSEIQPAVARILPTIFPDNPLVLEGLSAIYLNSERAADLTEAQVNALYGWLNAGGHLIIAVEQPNDINSTAWLKALVPCDIADMTTLQTHPELQSWLKSATWSTIALNSRQPPLPGQRDRQQQRILNMPGNSPFPELEDDFKFETSPMQVAKAILREGQSLVTIEDKPVIVTTARGCGRVTMLLFSPEREPVRSWKNLPVLWAKIAEVPGNLYLTKDFGNQGSWSSDGLFGAMIETTQVHKLPIGWLLLLLVVYLVVIGPLDQYWLKRINKPMLTWITFPCYVAMFSLLIYFIGYKLRAGESEWNELHLVDILSNGERAELRGRTYASVYSPANQRYPVEGNQKYATIRGEFAGLWGGGQSSERAEVTQVGDSFKADLFVPVWTSQMFVNDWWQGSPMPMNAEIKSRGDRWEVKIDNQTDHKLTDAQVVVEGNVYGLGEIGAKGSRVFLVPKDSGTLLRDFVTRYAQTFTSAAQSRQRAFGGDDSGRIADLPHSTVATSFLSQMNENQNYAHEFVAPPGLDMSVALDRGRAIVFAWAGDFSPVKPFRKFNPRRSHTNTLWRMAVPVQGT